MLELRCVMRATGHETLHTLDSSLENHMTDAAILGLAASEGRVVVTKDDDFVQSHLISGRPRQLLPVATGNIGNAGLGGLLRVNLTD